MSHEDYRFDRSSLDPQGRKEGISAFMRIKNADEFVEACIESHIDHFDEIVACYNQCTDRTEEILNRLAERYPNKVKVYHYEPEVHPLGSEGHKNTKPDSIHSFANYSNYALSKTTRKVVTKLDDDHFAIQANLISATDYIRTRWNRRDLLVFSGINLLKNQAGRIGVYRNKPFSGNGDIFFFSVSPDTYFDAEPRYEIFITPKRKKVYVGLLYLHLKYLKKESGFANYQLADNPRSRYARILDEFQNNAVFQEVAAFINDSKKPANLAPLFENYYLEKIKYYLSRAGLIRTSRFAYQRVVELPQAMENATEEIRVISKL